MAGRSIRFWILTTKHNENCPLVALFQLSLDHIHLLDYFGKMKKLILIEVCLLCLFNSLSSQVAFMDSTYIWTEYQIPMSGEPYVTRYTFSAEPMEINGFIYYERLQSGKQNGNHWEHTGIGYRSDTTGKVYVYKDNQEYPVYDYKLSVNDSLAIGEYGVYLTVDFIDSIMLENGDQRKRLAMRCSFDTDPEHGWGYKYWIEGIGGTNGVQSYFFDDCLPDGGGTTTLCISRNDTLLYTTPYFDSCWYHTVATISVKDNPVVIFPNPTKDIIHISGVLDYYEITIWNGTGAFIGKQSGNLIDLTSEPEGIYFISLNLSGNRKQFFRRIIKI